MEKGKSGKATWDVVAHRVFLDVCIEEVEANNRPTQCLNAVGYANLISKFNERTKRNYDRKQMKNRWETLKKDYNTWKTLTQHASGIGRDPNTHTIAASDEWWENEIKRCPDASKFRNAALQDEEKMSIIFDKHCVTNEHARVPTRSAHFGPSEDAHIVIDGDENDSGCEGDDYVTPVLGGKGKGKPKRACPYSPSPATKVSKVAKEENPTEVQRLLSIMESRSRSKHSATSQVSVNPARQELRDMVAQVVRVGGTAGSDEHFYATQLFMKQEYRDAFSTFDMRFIFSVPGWPGSVHDTRVWNDARIEYDTYPHPPQGKYYLVDSGYPNRVGYLAPYKGQRYHVPEFEEAPPVGMQKTFNHCHSSLRNVIERAFGVLKMKWRILQGIPAYPPLKQKMIISACMCLHNYIRDSKLRDEHFDHFERGAYVQEDGPTGVDVLVGPDDGTMGAIRDGIAASLVA